MIVPEIADLEVRRSLLLSGMYPAVVELNALRQVLTFQPITSAIMLRAAELWGDARRRGRPTADPKELDDDVILAAQALEAGGIVATGNVGHLAQFVSARGWRKIGIP